MSSAVNLSKQFEFRSGPTKLRAWGGFILFDTLMVFIKSIFETVNLKKNIGRLQKSWEKKQAQR